MGQNFAAQVATAAGGGSAYLALDTSGRLITGETALRPSYNITTATVVKGTPGYLVRINVIVAGSTNGTANDCATAGAAAVANEIYVIPMTVGSVVVNWPCATGIVIVPGTGQTVAVSYA